MTFIHSKRPAVILAMKLFMLSAAFFVGLGCPPDDEPLSGAIVPISFNIILMPLMIVGVIWVNIVIGVFRTPPWPKLTRHSNPFDLSNPLPGLNLAALMLATMAITSTITVIWNGIGALWCFFIVGSASLGFKIAVWYLAARYAADNTPDGGEGGALGKRPRAPCGAGR